MAELWLPQGGVNRKQKELWLPQGGVNRKQKELWAGSGGVNRKTFSGGIPASGLAVGTKIKIYDTSASKYLKCTIAHHGLPSSNYSASCNGTFVVLNDYLVVSGVAFYSDQNTLMFSGLETYAQILDGLTQSAMKTVKIPYCDVYNIYWGESGYSCRLFPLSVAEVGGYSGLPQANSYPFIDLHIDGAKLDLFLSGNTPEAISLRANIFGPYGSAIYFRSLCRWDEEEKKIAKSYANGGGLYGSYISTTNRVSAGFILYDDAKFSAEPDLEGYYTLQA